MTGILYSEHEVLLIHVQFPGGKPRTCEDLKGRYYKVARALAIAREGSEESIANLTIVKHPFNAQHERSAPALY
jgi:DNA methyltransferase 1-associated protein 1